MRFEDSREFAASLDQADPLARYREQFNFPLFRDGRAPVYLVGNSLGLQPKLAAQYVEEELGKWKDHAVGGFFHPDRPWLTCARSCTAG
ncbi:MAG: kynureninase, partial [Chromatiales bacterium]